MTEKPESGEVAGAVATAGNGKKLMERAWDALMAAGTADGTALPPMARLPRRVFPVKPNEIATHFGHAQFPR